MRKLERVEYISQKLEELYPVVPIPLDHTTTLHYWLPFYYLLSALDERVNKVTPALFEKADNPFDMIKLSVEEIREIIKPCGLSPRKSKAVYDLSQILIEKFDGDVPESFEELEKLPGVGHKTASVVMSQGFGHPAFPVDTHIHRLAQRWELTSGKNVEETEKDLEATVSNRALE